MREPQHSLVLSPFALLQVYRLSVSERNASLYFVASPLDCRACYNSAELLPTTLFCHDPRPHHVVLPLLVGSCRLARSAVSKRSASQDCPGKFPSTVCLRDAKLYYRWLLHYSATVKYFARYLVLSIICSEKISHLLINGSL